MLSRESLVRLFDHLGTPQSGRRLVEKARVEAPVREVKSRGSNVITFLVSQKMGRGIRTESRHIEFAAAVDHEHDPNVLEYYAQPCKLDLELIEAATGEVHRIHHFPDFLVLREGRIVLEEWKPVEKLARLAEKYPYRYEKDRDGRWRAPQIERHLAERGISYCICTDESIPRRRVENLLHLADYFHPGAEPCDEQEVRRLQAALVEHGALYIADLTTTAYGFSADFLFKAIADQQVVADLDREVLTKPRQSRLYRDAILRDFMAGEVRAGQVPRQGAFVLEIAEGAKIQYQGQVLTISLVSEKEIVCSRAQGGPVTLTRDWLTEAFENGQIVSVGAIHVPTLNLARYSQRDLELALRRKAILLSQSTNVCERTKRYWKARQAAARANGGNEVLALVPRTSARGNRTSRLSDEQEGLILAVINKYWRSHEAANYKSCYRHLQVLCDTAGVPCPSYPTMIARIKAEETARDLRTRYGKRMAYQMGEFVDVLYYDTPQHGSRPFQYVHIDHTQADIELISGRTGKPLGRPWLSLVVDAFTRRILALYLTFDPPSYHSVMMVVRDMVRRFQRLPEFIVVDNGRDFMSAAFESFLEAMGTHLRFRPAGQPRHGAVLERMFGRVHSEYVHNLAGNTKATKNVRMTTGKHLPVKFAEWTLESLYYGLEHWAFEYYDQETHLALDCSPREMFQRGLQESGSRPHRQLLCNRDFLIATCPPVDREGLPRVNNQRGVKVNGLLYWNPVFRNPRIANQRLPVRYDPWDASSVYVWINNQWVQAVCRTLIGLGQLTELERQALTEEYLSKSGSSLDDDRAIQRLREFMEVFTPDGAMGMAMSRQEESKSLYNRLQLANITPVVQRNSTHPIKEDIAHTEWAARPITFPASTTQPEASVADDAPLPDFDTF